MYSVFRILTENMWPISADEHLVQEIYARPLLYALTDKNYYNKIKKEKAWREVAAGISAEGHNFSGRSTMLNRPRIQLLAIQKQLLFLLFFNCSARMYQKVANFEG